MIDALAADQVTRQAGETIALCGRMALVIECAERDSERMCAAAPVTVYCQLELNEETATLVGFSDRDRRSLYRALRGVQGIGRRSALAVLDCGEVTDTLRAVAGKDSAYFASVPGLGAKRVGAVIEQLARRYRDALPHPLPVPVSDWVEARDALVSSAAAIDYHQAEIRLRELVMQAERPMSAEQLVAAVLSTS